MSSVAQAITVPRDSANDDYGIVVRWLQHSGDRVQAGDVICELEFSKAVVEIESDVTGFIQHRFAEGDEAPVGETLAFISDEEPGVDNQESAKTRPTESPSNGAPSPTIPTIPTRQGGSAEDSDSDKHAHHDFRITAKAQRVIEEHGLSPELFAEHAIIKERHVLKYLGQQEGSLEESNGGPKHSLDCDSIDVSPIRRHAAAALSKSWQEIPHSLISRFLVAKNIEERASRLGERHDMSVSVSDLLVEAAVTQAAKDGRVLRRWSNGRILQARQVNIGFALNQRNGDLLVPVIRDADHLDFESLVGRIRGLQKAAIRRALKPADLNDGALTVTSLVGSHVHSVTPIIAPNQSVIVALSDRIDGPGAASYSLTMAFDHRVLNGSEAAKFLYAIARQLEESP